MQQKQSDKQSLNDAQLQQLNNQGSLNVKPETNIALNAMTANSIINLQIIPPKGIQRTPLDICCVIDTSGSMQSMATVKSADGKDESSGLTVLDLVKHAVKTLIHNLSPEDNLAIVNYDDVAYEALKLTKMDKKGQKIAIEKTESLQVGGCTNLWGGLQSGMDILKDNVINKNQAVLLFTDGQPNVEPPRGHIPTLKKYLDSNQTNFCINTYGFGYNLNSQLLSDIASIGNGQYGFIPDSGFVGTIFVNALSNLLCNVGVKANLSIEAMNGAELIFNDKNQIPGFPQSIKTNWGANIPLGSIVYDQIRDIPLQLNLTNHKQELPAIFTKLTYNTLVGKNLTESLELEIPVQNNDNQENDFYIETQILRIKTINTILEALDQNINFKEKGEMVQKLISQFKLSKVIQNPDNQLAKDLFADVSGQIQEAVSREDWFQKWGRHYIPSLVCAHYLQQANNFKDVGVQHYGGKLFQELRDQIEATFLKLPPPQPSKPVYEKVGNQKVQRKVNMAQYHNYAGSCFAKNSLILMQNGQQKLVQDIKKGDIIHSGQTIECIVKTESFQGKALLVTLDNNLKITPYHPIINNNGQWQFPQDISEIKFEKCEAVYSFLLKERQQQKCNNAIIVNGYQAATLGHGQKGQVIEHSYFGTENVVNDLKSMKGWEQGIIVLQAGCLVKSKETGLVIAMKQTENQQQAIQLKA